MKALETVVVILVVIGIVWYISRYSDKCKMYLTDMFDGTPYVRGAGIVKCETDLGDYYKQKYTDRWRYQPISTDARDHNQLMANQAALTQQAMWAKKMGKAMDGTYVDNKGVAYAPSGKKLATNAGIPPGSLQRAKVISAAPSPGPMTKTTSKSAAVPVQKASVPASTKEKFVYNRLDDNYWDGHESMTNNRTDLTINDLVSGAGKVSEPEMMAGELTVGDLMRSGANVEGMTGELTVGDLMRSGTKVEGMADKSPDKNAPLTVSDLLPDPCQNNGKDWTNVFTECENLVGGQNFVRFEDEHFTNQVLDTRCTKLLNLDLRRLPPIQYADVSIWNKPSVCKNIFEYIRPSLDSDC